MKSLIDVFRMEEIEKKTRAAVIIKLGRAINSEHAMNITEPLVYELVALLDGNNPILKDEQFLKRAGGK